MKKIITSILGAAIVSTTNTALATESNFTFETKAQDIANELVNTYGITSVQYAIIDNGNIILSGSSGVYDKLENLPVEKDNMYGIGSVSKVYVTAAVMTLVDQGLVDIDEPLTTYLPEFKMADERYKQITPRMLMNHSSGIYGTHFAYTMLFDDNDTTARDTLLSNLEQQTLRAAPGEFSEYCNDGFTLLEILVEQISGISYTQFISEYFSKPLGIENTKTPLDDFDRNRLVRTYMPMYENSLPVDTSNILGTGGLYSTAEDMCKFAEVLMGNKPEILSAESAIAMQNEEFKNGTWVEDGGENFFGYGLGWDTVNGYPFADYGIKVLAKGGDTLSFHSILVAIPEHNIAMAVNSSSGVSIYNYAFAATVLQHLLEEKGIIEQVQPIRTFEAPIAHEMLDDMRIFSGTYANSFSQMNIEFNDDQLNMPALIGGFIPPQNYVYTGNYTFTNSDGSVSLKFVEHQDDNIYLQVTAFITLPNIGQVVWTSYDSQKLTYNTISESMLNAWSNRAGKRYYLVSEKPTSQFYFVGGDIAQVKLNDDITNGFVYAGSQIIDDNSAINTLRFRDVTDINFYTQDEIEYLEARSFVFIGEDDIYEIYGGENSISTIQENGFARYYRIGEDTQGKTISVNIPEDAAYIVYDENGICINFTTVSENNETILPQNGMIAFIGNARDVFEITLKP